MFLDVFSALYARFEETKNYLSQAPQDTTLEYPHAIPLMIFLGDIFWNFGIFGIFECKFLKTRDNLKVMFTVLNPLFHCAYQGVRRTSWWSSRNL